MPRITPNLWFDTEAEEAAHFYVSVFPNSEITSISRYNEAGPRESGTVLTVDFVLDGISVNAWDSTHPYSTTETGPEALTRALASWSNPEIRPEHREELLNFAQRTEGLATANWEKGPYRAMRQNALLQLIGISPDLLLQ